MSWRWIRGAGKGMTPGSSSIAAAAAASYATTDHGHGNAEDTHGYDMASSSSARGSGAARLSERPPRSAATVRAAAAREATAQTM